MNIFLNSLRLSCFLHSPFVENSYYFLHRKLEVRESSFKKFAFSGFVVREGTLSVSGSSFQEFLHKSVEFGRELNASIISSRRINTFYPLKFQDTVFRRIIESSSDGGAFISFAETFLQNCLFVECNGKSGGGFSCHSSVLISFCTFSKCISSARGGSFFVSGNSMMSLTTNFSILFESQAVFFGAFYKDTKGPTRLNYINVSRSSTTQCVAGFESTGGEFEMKYSLLYKSISSSHNGGIVVRQLTKMHIESCIFRENSQRSSISQAAAVLLLYSNPGDSFIKESAFIRNDPDKGYSISVVDGKELFIYDSCFSGKHERELYNNNGHIKTQAVLFEKKCSNAFSYQQAGFSEKNPRDIYEKPVSFNMFRWNLFISSLIVSVLLSLLMSILHKRVIVYIWKKGKSWLLTDD